MKFLVIGQCVLDTIIKDSIRTIQPGGIYYTISGFNSIKSASDEIDLLTETDNESQYYFPGLFSQINILNKSKVSKIPSVHLFIREGFEREEKYENFNANLDISVLPVSLEYDGILLNMITGKDILLEDMKKIRERYSGEIYCDIHTLSRGIDAEGNRTFRRIPAASDWLSCIDILQANELEFKTLCESDNEKEIAEFVINSGVSVFIITRGEAGVTCYSNKNGINERMDIPAVKVKAVNTVGCGDIFGSVFFYSYIYSSNLKKSLQKAVFAASEVAKFKNINGLKNLKNAIDREYIEKQDTDNRL